MNDALLLALGALLGFIAATWRGLRGLYALRAEALAAETAADELAQRCADQELRLAQMAVREALAAANIVALSYALTDATAQVQAAHGDGAQIVAMGGGPLQRFSLN